jgi:hypothetical protein
MMSQDLEGGIELLDFFFPLSQNIKTNNNPVVRRQIMPEHDRNNLQCSSGITLISIRICPRIKGYEGDHLHSLA